MFRHIYFIALLLICSGILRAEDTSWVKIVDTVKPAIVVINTENGLATGFFINPNGIIATNHHVIKSAQNILITLQNGESFDKAYLLAEDETRDLAILKVDTIDVCNTPLGNSNDVKVGENVLLVGTPIGFDQTFSNGIISNIRILDNGVKVLQTTAPASPGSSGGPLINISGEAIGVMTYGFSEAENLNFAVSINYLRGMLQNIKLTPPLSPVRTLTRLSHNTLPSHSDQKAINPSNTASTPSQPVPNDSVLFFAQRTDNHTERSSAEVFRDVVDNILIFLKSNKILLANDRIDQSMMASSPSMYDLFKFNRNYVGASHILYLTVDRPFSRWISLTIECYDRDGKLLWEEKSESGWSSLNSNHMPIVEKLQNKILDRISETPLPVVSNEMNSTNQD